MRSVTPSDSSSMVGVDVGGTFTDVVSVGPDGVTVTKVPTDPVSSDVSVLEGARTVDVGRADVFNLASTAGLNSILTRRTPKVALVITEGHRDILDVGTGARPVQFLTDPTWHRSFSDASRPLVPRYLRREIRERVTATGDVLVPLDEEQARHQLRVLGRCGVTGVAVCLLHSHLRADHEQRLRELVREELGDVECSISSDVSPIPRTYGRASTTVIDVVMKSLYGAYTKRLYDGLDQQGFHGSFNYADCRAMLMPADYALERPFRLVAGGPAAGTVSCRHFGTVIGESNIICADVGGTSCDISVVVGEKPWVNPTFDLEHDLGVNALAVDIITLGAGGGSIIWISRSGDILVGPQSAGANPGPACYGLGGTAPTMTDAALLMGILQPGGLLGGRVPLDVDLAVKAFEGLDTPLPFRDRVADAWKIGLHNIAEGLLNIGIRRGIDPREFTLMAYGAAGPMELGSMLDLLPLKRVVVPPNPGLFSALGLVSADQVFADERGFDVDLTSERASEIEAIFRALEERLLARAPAAREQVRLIRTFDGRLVGQGFDTPFVEAPSEVTAATIEEMVARFHDVYEQRFGNRFASMPVVGGTWRVEAVVEATKVEYERRGRRVKGSLSPSGRLAIRYLYGEDTEAAEYRREELFAGDELVGPAVVREDLSTTFVPAGRTLRVGDFGELEIR